MSENKISFIIDELAKLFPLAKCELDYHNIYELSVAVILSAQTTDKAVNKVTPELFRHYLTVNDLANANYPDVEKIISSIGLSYKKSHYIVDFSKDIMNLYQGQIPNNLDDLIKIKGVGRKTANVILSEGYHLPALAVDVHVARCAKRLGLVENQDDPYKIEMKLIEIK